MAKIKKVIKHLKGDIKTFKDEAKEDRELIRSLKTKKHEKPEKGESKAHERKEKKDQKPKAYPKGKVAEHKEKKVFDEAKAGKLHSGSKNGPLVKKRSQVIAIALSEARKAVKKKKK